MERSALIERILELSFVQTYNWTPPVVQPGVGPTFSDAFAEFDAKNRSQIETCRQFLDTHSDQELNVILITVNGRTPILGPPAQLPILQTLELAKKIAPPPWYAGGFSVQGREPDYDYWVRMKSWELDDATALSLGYEPCGSIDAMQPQSNVRQEVLDFQWKRRSLIENNFFPFGKNTLLKPSPSELCEWASRTSLEVRPELFASMTKISGTTYQIPKPPEKAIELPLEPRERQSLLLLVQLLAVKFYNFDGKRLRSDVPNQIQSDLDLLGQSLHLDTIRKYIREAAAIPPNDDKAD